MASIKQTLAFDPRSLSNCALWLDAADTSTLVMSGSSVSQWRDKSGSGNNSTYANLVTYSSNSVNALGVINFGPGGLNNGSMISGSISPTYTGTQVTCFIVASMKSESYIYNRFLSLGASGGNDYQTVTNIQMFGRLEGLNIGISYNNQGLSSSISEYDSVFLGYSARNSSTLSFGINGNSPLLGNSGTTGNFLINFYALGASTSSQTGLSGKMCEVLIYNSALSTSQRQQVEGYLAWKWGLIANLPFAHPFKRAPIAPFSFSLIPIRPKNTIFPYFDPRTISGCRLWFDAADSSSMTLSGNNVTQWRDKSGNGRNATTSSATGPTLSNTPQFKNTSLYFNSSNHMAIANNTLVNPNGFLFVVFQEDAGETSQKFVIQNFSAFGIQEFQYDTTATTIVNAGFWAAGWSSRITSLSVTAAEILQTSGKLNSYTNGSLTNSTNVPTTSATGDTADGTNIARYTFNNSEGYVGRLKGFLAEILYYNTTLTSTQRQQIEGYLAWKWGIQAKLPSSHLYALAPPNLLQVTAAARPRGAKWLPTQITGCQLWLDAADTSTISLSGTNVTQWRDKSSNGYLFSQGTDANRPRSGLNTINKLNVITNQGSQFLQITNWSQNFTTATVFYIVRPTNSFATWDFLGVLMSPRVNGTPYIYIELLGLTTPATYSTAFSAYLNGGFSGDLGTASIVGNTYLVTGLMTGVAASNIVNVNGAQVSTNLYPAGNANFTSGLSNVTLYTAGSAGAIASTKSGLYAEILFYSGVLSKSQYQQVEGYLAWKWGLQTSLPASHPYAKFPPPS